jgi:AraC family transcriptional regulator of adaptative response/methylated-DNA-[protein]-cysteine methyltransferase
MKVITKIAQKSERGKDKAVVWGIHPFPTGKILVAMTDEGICFVGVDCTAAGLKRHFPAASLTENTRATAPAARDIAKLWPDKMHRLDIPVVLYGSDFQQRVWRELLKIKSGATVTYEYIARKIGQPTAVRAVGTAIGRNPVSIVVPCHRVVNKSGGRVNYGWGADAKIALLTGEGAI